ncbi:MAG: CocE/NonD family hydrolase [Thermoguttaceae bacterium]|jgi:putative CocE/NonD family hydrolase|nr:CocE/NonD family hydrolase [Thermoguttaceae bacterium]
MQTLISYTTALWILLAAPVAWAQPQPGDYSPASYEVIEELDRTAAMRDGVELRLDVFRPDAEGPFPAILQQTPYNKSGQAARARRFAARGYAVVNVDSRGRFQSGGDWDPFSPLHKTDGYDLVEWAAGQPWCSGSVGTYGLSYMGWTQWWTATQAPPSLKAIVPEVAPPDHFFNCPYQNGIFVCWMMDWAGMMSGRLPHAAGPGPYGGFAVNREQAYRQTPYADFDRSRGYLPTAWWRKWITQNTSAGEYWRAIAYQTPEDYARVTVPSLAITGWFDANFPGTPMNYLGMKQHGGTAVARQPRMVIGPWEHIVNSRREAAGVDFGPQAVIDWDGYVCRWFDHYLKGIDNNMSDDPPIHLFVMGRNQWRTATDWPLPETRYTRYYLRSGGRANSSAGDGKLSLEPPGADEPDDHYVYDPDDPTPSAGFTNGHIDGPRDISESAARPDVLVYTTDELAEDVELIGPITAKLYAATSAADTDWMIRLADVHPDGRALFLGEGMMRARHRDPQREGAFNPQRLSTIQAGEAYEYTIEFWRPTGNRFARGHRIRIEISSSYYPYYLRNLNTGEDNIALAREPVIARQTVFHDSRRPSHIVFPVIPAEE